MSKGSRSPDLCDDLNETSSTMTRPRPLAWLKPLVVPIWNSSYRVALRVEEYLGAVRHRRFGYCEVCGWFGLWLYQRRVVPPKLEALWGLTARQAEALATKESSACHRCGTKLRGRRLARVVLDTYHVGTPPAPASSMNAWITTSEARSLRIAEINRIDGLHQMLSNLRELAFSDFNPEGVGDGVRSEDLTQLTYPDASFDLVLTSESLEHVPDLGRALSEIHRVLAPGGRHIFTVPLLPNVPCTFPRSVLHSDGTIEHIRPMIRHPGGDVGYPVFTEFGMDLGEIMKKAGFEVDLAFGPVRDDDIAQVWICRKSPRP